MEKIYEDKLITVEQVHEGEVLITNKYSKNKVRVAVDCARLKIEPVNTGFIIYGTFWERS